MCNDGSLWEVDLKTGTPTELADEVGSCRAAGNGVVFFTDTDGTLYFNDKSHEVEKFVSRYIGRDDGGALYVDEDGDLYTVDRFGKTKKVDDDVSFIFRDGKYFYYTKEDGDVYINENGKKFERIRGVEY